MSKLDKSDLFTLEEYRSKREGLKKEVLEIKKNRQIKIGSNVTLIFENSVTIKYQIQEKLRIEKIFEEEGVEEELSAYNLFIPDGSNLKATMLIIFSDEDVRTKKLNQLLNIEKKVWLQVGENDRVFATANENLEITIEENTSATYSLRFELSNLMTKDLKSGSTMFVGVELPGYNVRTQEIPRNISNSLLGDLT